MLAQLRVENYAVIDHIQVDFSAGLNLLTGETGAGKSIIIDALALLLGDKASPDVVRHGTEKATVAAVFEVDAAVKPISALLEANGIDSDDPSRLILRREILANGKARVFINNQPATVAVLKQLAPHLAFIHAQNETLAHFDGDERRKLLDSFGNIDATHISELYSCWIDLRDRIRQLEHGEQERLRNIDLWSFQSNEIESARLVIGEDTQLEAERALLINAERLYAAAMSAYSELYEDDRSATTTLRSATKHVEELARFDARFLAVAEQLASARALIDDASATARDFAESINASPERLAHIEERLNTLHLLRRKYGQTIADIVQYGQELKQRLNEIENRDELLAGLRKQLTSAEGSYLTAARALHSARSKAAEKLRKSVEIHLNDLAMNARFSVEVAAEELQSAWRSHGIDAIQYLIATNAGEPMKPLEQIASGGELSRVMLALKASIFENSVTKGNGSAGRSAAPIRTLVFDEIDTGIGGRAADAVGRKLKQLSRTHQVLCITHLPQIASCADHHFVIAKREQQTADGPRTRTSVRPVTGRERTEEVARMLSGAELTSASIKNAEQMLRANA